MAFTTTQAIDSVLLRGLNFRTPANSAISSQYILYANGAGQTYWSNSIAPNNLSTLSTTIGINYASTVSVLQFQSTVIGTVNFNYLSSVTALVTSDSLLSNANLALSNQINRLSNQTNSNINTLWNSTVTLVNSTLLGISTLSTFYKEIGAVQSSVNASASTLSTTINRQNTSTYVSLTSNYIVADTKLWNSTLNTVGAQLSSISSVVAYQTTVNTLSTILTNQLLSSIAGTYIYIDTRDGVTTSSISTLYKSTIQPLESTVVGIKPIAYSLSALSTNISSISYGWISSFVSTSQYYQDVYTFDAIQNLSSAVSSLNQSTLSITQSYSTFSTNYTRDKDNAIVQNAILNSTVVGLQFEFNVITTSSILAGIYVEFIDLEYYTSTLIGSTIGFANEFTKNLFYSTQFTNISTSEGYFDYYVSTLYASTLSTLIPSTIEFTSSMVSTLYSTSYTYITSTFNSTLFALTDDYNSTISSYTNIYISTVNDNTYSTVLGYISTPGGELISTISTLDYVALSTFQSTSVGQLSDQSTLFYSSFLSWQSTFYDLSGTANNLIYLQSSLLLSSMTSYPSTLYGSLNSTNTALLTYATSLTTQTLTNIENSTTAAYNSFTESLGAIASTQALSTLYTSIDMSLAGNTYTATMDFATYRNFNITVYDVINGQSNYLINYQSNSLDGLDYRGGIININISTVGLAYDNNNKQLGFDVYRWGIPTAVWGNKYPYISSAAYTLQYQYNIINNIVYTNLLNIYPKLAVQSPAIMANTGKNVYVSTLAAWSLSNFWRGSAINVEWRNYSFFPYGSIGGPPFNPEISIDVTANGILYSTYGPYFLSQSTATVYAPYLTQQLYPTTPTNINVYMVGLQSQQVTTTFNTITPGFDTISMKPFNYSIGQNIENIHWIGGQELVGVTDGSNYPLFGLNPNVTTTLVAPTVYYCYDGLSNYQAANLLAGPYNTIGASMVSTITTNAYRAGSNWLIDNSVGPNYLYIKVALTNDIITTLAAVTPLGATARFTISDPTDAVTISFTPQITFSTLNAGLSVYNLTVPACTTTSYFFPNMGSPCYLAANVRYYLFTDTGGNDRASLALDNGSHTVDFTRGPGFRWYVGSGDVAGSWRSLWQPYAKSYLYPSLTTGRNAISYVNGGLIEATFALIVLADATKKYPVVYSNFFLSDSTYVSIYFDNKGVLSVKPSWSTSPFYTKVTPGINLYTIQVVRTKNSLTLYLSYDTGQYVYPNISLYENFVTTTTQFGAPLYTYTAAGTNTFVDRVQLVATGTGVTPVYATVGLYVYLNDIPTLLSTINYIPSTFVGPSGSVSGADQLASANIVPLLTSNALFTSRPIDAINRLAYYNLNSDLGNVPSGIDSNATANMTITGSVYYKGEAYQSTFSTNTSLIQNFIF